MEIYFPGGAGKTILQNLYLLRWTNGNANASISTAYLLQNRTVGADGFFVVCQSATAAALLYPSTGVSTCDDSIGSGGPVDSNGDDNIGLVLGPLIAGPFSAISVVDIFGVPGEQGLAGTTHSFIRGRAERRANAQIPRSTYNVSDWNVTSGGLTFTDMTPRYWAGALTATTPAPATSITNSPASAPVTATPTSSVTLSPVTASPVTPAPTTPTLTIQAIQGTQDVSPYVGQTVLINNAFVTAIVYNGFFIQEVPTLGPDASSGIFVFTGASIPQIVIGNQVSVRGTVQEFSGWTEIASSATTVIGNSSFFFSPVTLTLPISSKCCGQGSFESYESMLVSVGPSAGDNLVVSEYFNLDRYGKVYE